MSNTSNNTYSFSGQMKFDPSLKTTSTGKAFLPITVEADKATISVALFEEVATALAAQARQGTQIIVQGYQNQRKDPQSGYWYNSAIGTAYSLDNGNTWVDQKSLRQQGQQQTSGFQPPVNQQTQHLQQCQQQFQQPQPQPLQQQPVQPQTPQQPPAQQAQGQAQQQSRDQFLNSNQYRGNQPPSAAATQAQQDLYSPPSLQQSGSPVADQLQQSASQPAAAPQPPAPTSDKPVDEFDDSKIPF